MIPLIDSFTNDPQTCINNKWYIAKPLNYSRGYYIMKNKLKGIFLVLKNKAIVVQFAQDRKKDGE